MLCLSFSSVPLGKYGSDFEANKEQLESEKMLNQLPVMWKYGYQQKQCSDLSQVVDTVKSNYRCYSAGQFTDGKAKDSNWTGQNMIILDIDDGLSLDRAKDIFAEFKAVIITSKSHQRDKNGTMCDRFRVIMPLRESITCDAETYKETMRFIMCHKYTFVDKQCKDPSRIYFGYTDENTKVIYTQSERLFDFNEWIEKMNKSKEIVKWCDTKEKQIASLTQSERKEFADNGTKADWFRANWKTEKILNAIKFNEKFYKGGRNGTLFSWAKYLMDEVGLSDSETTDLILWINAQGDGISESEINNTIFKSLRISA